MEPDERGAGRDRGSRSTSGGPDSGGGGAGRRRDPVVRILLVLTGLLALGAAAVAVLGDDGRMLRLGVVAGLWATLLAVVALARRGPSSGSEDATARVASLRRTYEAELAAEVDARHEHELTVEQAVRREVAAERNQELVGWRAEVERLRSELDQLESHAARPTLQTVPHGRPHTAAPAGPPPAPRRGGPPGPRRRDDAPGPPAGPDPAHGVEPAPQPSRASAAGPPASDGRSVAGLLAEQPTPRRRRGI